MADARRDGKSGALVEVDFDDRAAHEYGLGTWPWDRRVIAHVIEWLRIAGARTVMLDLLGHYPARDPAADRAFVAASRRAGNVIFPALFQPVPERDGSATFRATLPSHVLHAEVTGLGDIPGAGNPMLPLPALLETASAIGHVVRAPDADGVARRVPLVYAAKGGFVPSLALAAAFRHLDVDPASVRIERGQALRFKPRGGDEVVVPVDRHGRTWINYAGPWGTRFLHYPYSWLLDQTRTPEGSTQLPAWFRDRSVVIVNVTTPSGDLGATPFDRIFHFGEIYLHVLNMLLTQQFLRDATPVEAMLSTGIPVAVLTAAALAGGPGLVVPAYGIVLVLYLVVLQRAFASAGVILPAVTPVLALTGSLVVLLTVRFLIVDRERHRFESILGVCLPPQTVRDIRQSPGRIPGLLAGRRRELTILFADIQGFSTFCQNSDPLEIQRVLREYLTAMTEMLRAHGGTLDKYMGDGIMAFFGDAEPEGGGDRSEEERVERHAANAVRAGLAMQVAMLQLNERWQSQGRPLHLVRIGINTGVVTVGNLGTEHLWDYTVVGPEVNKAQRLESAAEAGGLLLSRRTYALARKRGVLPEELRPTSAVLKGIGEQTDLYPVSLERVAAIRTANLA